MSVARLSMPTNNWHLTLFGEINAEQSKSWLVRGLFGAGEMTCVYGLPGCGKSVLLGDAACHVAAGRPWFGRPVAQGAVLYLAAERSGLVMRRFAAWRQRYGLDGLSLGVLTGAFDLTIPEGATGIVEAGRQLVRDVESPLVWLIVDTKSRTMGAGDPNSDRDVQLVVSSLASAQRALGDPHVTIVDHVPHGSPDRMKGSGVLAGAVDGSFLVRRDGPSRVLTIGSKPPNDGPDELEIMFGLESEVIGRNEDGEETTAPIVIPADREVAPQQVTKTTPSVAEGKVMSAFGRLLDEERTVPAPNVPGVPQGQRAVTLADLRDKALEIGIFPVPEPGDVKERARWRNGRNAAWKRGIGGVQRKRLLRTEQGLVWEVRSSKSLGDER
jgi:hypothetical protein